MKLERGMLVRFKDDINGNKHKIAKIIKVHDVSDEPIYEVKIDNVDWLGHMFKSSAFECVMPTLPIETSDKTVTKDTIEKEDYISKCLVRAWNTFLELEQTHHGDIEDFNRGIHDLQKVIGMRELRRLMPEKYPIK